MTKVIKTELTRKQVSVRRWLNALVLPLGSIIYMIGRQIDENTGGKSSLNQDSVLLDNMLDVPQFLRGNAFLDIVMCSLYCWILARLFVLLFQVPNSEMETREGLIGLLVSIPLAVGCMMGVMYTTFNGAYIGLELAAISAFCVASVIACAAFVITLLMYACRYLAPAFSDFRKMLSQLSKLHDKPGFRQISRALDYLNAKDKANGNHR